MVGRFWALRGSHRVDALVHMLRHARAAGLQFCWRVSVSHRVDTLVDALRHTLLVADGARVECLHRAVLVQVAALDLRGSVTNHGDGVLVLAPAVGS